MLDLSVVFYAYRSSDFRANDSINHFIVLKKDMRCTTHDLQYMGWSQQNASEFQMYPL